MTGMTYADTIEAHYAQVWAKPLLSTRWDEGPMHQLAPEFKILVIARSPEMQAYATCCMSTPEDEKRIELHMLAKPHEQSRGVIEILTAVAHYHRTGERLALGHSVNFGKPWSPGSSCTYGLVSLPYLDGPELEWSSHPRVQFLWLIPITAEEVSFKKRHGLEALEQRFEERQLDFLDPSRRSVV